MDRFPSERAVSLLQALGVRHVVIHTERLPTSHWQEMQEALSGAADLVLVETFGADRVYEVTPRAFDANELEVSIYFSAKRGDGPAIFRLRYCPQ